MRRFLFVLLASTPVLAFGQGLSFVSPDAPGSSVYPVSRGLVGAYFFGTSEKNPLKNWAPGGAPLTPVGSPTMNANSVTVGNNILYTTGLLETDSFTLVAVYKKTNAVTQTAVIGNRNADAAVTSTGSCIVKYNATSRVEAGDNNGTTASSIDTSAIPDGTYYFAAIAFDAGVKSVRNFFAYNGAVTTASAPMTWTRQVEPAIPWGVGPRADLAWKNPVDISAAAFHTVALTDAELTKVYNALRAKYAKVGINI